MGNRIAIFCHGQWGDAATCTSALKYKKELWGEDAKIVWYIAKENMDLLKYQDIELREFPRGFGYPELVEEENKKNKGTDKPLWEDWQPLVDENNHLDIELAKDYPSLQEFDLGYFPAPHQMHPKIRHGIEYPLVSKKVFDIPENWQWHPVLKFSEQERQIINHFMDNLPKTKLIAIESFAGSMQSKITHAQIIRTMEICQDVLGVCSFIFLSHKYLNGQETFPAEFLINNNIFFANNFTVRQCALIVGLCSLLISVSSGITVASSCWGNHPTPVLQYCGSTICSTQAIALGRFELVTHDEKTLMVAQNEYYEKLKQILNQIK